MTFIKYLKDNFRFIMLYIVLLTFVSGFVYIDEKNRMMASNISYLIFVSIFLMVIFIAYDYNVKKRYLRKLSMCNNDKDKTPILPEPSECKDEIYAAMIDELYRSCSKKLSILEKEFEDNKEFVAAWVHEIKTPIATSKLLIESGDLNLKSFKEEIDKIDDYVEKVLYYSRCDDFSRDYIISEVSVSKLVKESIKLHSGIFIKKRIRLNLEIDDDFCVDTDKKWLLFIINQIISNSLKYTSKEGTILVKAWEAQDEKLLLIEDNGIGIKKEDLSRIFAKSFTGYNGRSEASKSTGLGLYLSYKLAKKLGHNITVESEYNKGTKLYIHFPKWCDYYDVTKM